MHTNLLDYIAKLLNCEVIALHDYLNHPMASNKVSEFLKGKKLRTTYLGRNVLERKEVKFGSLSMRPASQQPAYEGYLGITVQQHYYCRHRIRLMYPRLRCIVEHGGSGHNKYYPPELLEVVEETESEVKIDKKADIQDWCNDVTTTDTQNLATPWYYASFAV